MGTLGWVWPWVPAAQGPLKFKMPVSIEGLMLGTSRGGSRRKAWAAAGVDLAEGACRGVRGAGGPLGRGRGGVRGRPCGGEGSPGEVIREEQATGGRQGKPGGVGAGGVKRGSPQRTEVRGTNVGGRRPARCPRGAPSWRPEPLPSPRAGSMLPASRGRQVCGSCRPW